MFVKLLCTSTTSYNIADFSRKVFHHVITLDLSKFRVEFVPSPVICLDHLLLYLPTTPLPVGRYHHACPCI